MSVRERLNACTKRQQVVYKFMVNFFRSHQRHATFREIADGIDISSPNGVYCHIQGLEKNGLLNRDDGKARGFRLAGIEIVEVA